MATTKKNMCTAAQAAGTETVTGVFVQVGGALRQASLSALQQALDAAKAEAQDEEDK